MKYRPSSLRESIRVFLIVEQAIIRAALKLLVESRAGFSVAGESAGWRELFSSGGARADVVVVEHERGRAPELDFVPHLSVATGGGRAVLLTSDDNTDLHCEAVRLGVMGIVMKGAPPDSLLKAIEKVHGGEVWLDRALTAKVLEQLGNLDRGHAKRRSTAGDALTPRELEVVRMVGQALSNQQIAERLFISPTTVRHHLTSIYSKLGVANRLELMHMALRQGLIRVDEASRSGSEGHPVLGTP